jgi:Domain of unknown function (DUF4333)
VPPVLRRGAALISVALLAFLGACSSDTTIIDAGKLEREITTVLERSNRVTSVECPEDVKAERGNSFTCAAEVEGTRTVIDVEQRNDNGRVVFAIRP